MPNKIYYCATVVPFSDALAQFTVFKHADRNELSIAVLVLDGRERDTAPRQITARVVIGTNDDPCELIISSAVMRYADPQIFLGMANEGNASGFFYVEDDDGRPEA